MSVAEQERTELTGAQKGEIALDFISSVANRLAVTPEFLAALARDFFNPNTQNSPRRYGVKVTKGLDLYHIVSYSQLELPILRHGHTSLNIIKYDTRLINSSVDQAFMGHIKAESMWNEVSGKKEFLSGSIKVVKDWDLEEGKKGITDPQLAIAESEELLDGLFTTPITFSAS
jgi:hypothetical protein